VRSLPARFRRPRIALVGFGDVAQRIANQHAQARGPAFVCASRSRGWNLDRAGDCRRLMACSTHFIVLVPPSEQHARRDLRSRALAAALRARGPSAHQSRGVYISTTGVYGDHAGGVVTETSACRTQQARSLRRLDAERIWRALGFHVLRVPGITAQDRLPLERIRAGSPALKREEDVFTNHIHADDLARISWRALWVGRPGRVTNAVDRSEMRMGDFFDAVALAAGLPLVPRISRADLTKAAQAGTVSQMMMSFLADSRRVRSKRLEEELGVRLLYPTVDDLLRSLNQRVRQGREC